MAKQELHSANRHASRVGTTFVHELESIIMERLNQGIDKKRTSLRKLTEWIVRHNSWPLIREDLIKINLENGRDV